MSIVILVGLSKYTLGFNLSDQIFSKFQSFYDKDLNSSISSVYSPNFSKDPYGEALSSIEDRGIKTKIAGSEYVEQQLSQMGCNLTKKEIWGILYYFVPEFRTELAIKLKRENGDYDSRKYMFDDDTIKNSCQRFFVCEKSAGYTAGQIRSDRKNLKYYNEEGDLRGITVSTPQNIETNCKEFFQENYRKGQANKQILQNVEVAQIGVDKYWNNSTNDSPYDIMVDLGIIAQLLYRDAQEPETPPELFPVSYKMPNFSNSNGQQQNGNNTSSSDSPFGSPSSIGTEGFEGGSRNGNVVVNEPAKGAVSIDGKNKGVSLVGVTENPNQLNKIDETLGEVGIIPLSNNGDDEYEDFVEGLVTMAAESDNSTNFGNVCRDDDETVVEPEGQSSSQNDDSIDMPELTDEEYQEIIDSLQNALRDYTSLTDELENEIEDKAGSEIGNGILNSTTSDELKDVENKIKKCMESCNGLRIDQKASCMLKCACSEVKSPVFNPSKTPGLGPIFILRFCGVPAVNSSFSVGGKRIHSIEEGLNEIFGVVDKLSSEGKLGKWTQQNEFLDSSTKQINMSKSVAFTISVEYVDVLRKSSQSDQYIKKKMEDINDDWQRNYGIKNDLTDVSSRNAYSVLGDGGTVFVFGQYKPLSVGKKVESSDLVGDSNAIRYSDLEKLIVDWVDSQGSFWKTVNGYISDFDGYAKALNSKKCN